MLIDFDAELWQWDARRIDSWVFVTVPVEFSQEIRDRTDGTPRRGFGSVRVHATIGDSTWTTSIFPDSERGSYVLPVKRAVRRAEDLEVGDLAAVTLELIDIHSD